MLHVHSGQYPVMKWTNLSCFLPTCSHPGVLPFHDFPPGLHQRLLRFLSRLLTDHFPFCLVTHRTHLPVLPPSLSNSPPPTSTSPPSASSGTLGGAAVCLSLATSPTTTTTRRQCVMRFWILLRPRWGTAAPCPTTPSTLCTDCAPTPVNNLSSFPSNPSLTAAARSRAVSTVECE